MLAINKLYADCRQKLHIKHEMFQKHLLWIHLLTDENYLLKISEINCCFQDICSGLYQGNEQTALELYEVVEKAVCCSLLLIDTQNVRLFLENMTGLPLKGRVCSVIVINAIQLSQNLTQNRNNIIAINISKFVCKLSIRIIWM